MTSIYRIQGVTQNYDWGVLGDVSMVANYAKASGDTIDNDKPYAELWMGTHPFAPSTLMDGKKTLLKDVMNSNTDLSTKSIHDQYNGDMPFILKIQSVRKALSIQAHPNKELGARLFKEFPQHYRDDNHKPEMVIALTPFELLFGFRPLEEIAQHLNDYPELTELVGKEVAQEFISAVKTTQDESVTKELLKKVYSSLMLSPQEFVGQQLSTLIARLNETNAEDAASQLVLRLDREHPGGDVGVFCGLFFNHVCLEPGQAIFIDANEPHAYLSGDNVECMATSDNVVRAGLTPKFKDVNVLVNMLTYRYGTPESQKMTPVKISDYSLLYDAPVHEFSVIWTNIDANKTEEQKPINGPSILIVTSGSGKLSSESGDEFELEEGYIYFVGANTPFKTQSGDSGLQYYTGFATA